MDRPLAYAALLLALWTGTAFADAAAPAEAAAPPAAPAVKVKLKVFDLQNRVAACQTFLMHGPQVGFSSYAHSPLKFEGPATPEADPLVCSGADCIAQNGEPIVLFPCDFSIFVKTVAGARQSLGWDEPSQQLFCASFPDGTQGVLRLPENYAISSGTLSVGEQTAPLLPYSPLAYAALQLAGEPQPDQAESQQSWSIENWIVAADTRSLLASAAGQDQAGALDFAAQAVHFMLAEYQRKHQAYPAALDQLWQGGNAVAPISPGNPYAWPAPLCAAPALAGPPQGLVYVPLYQAGSQIMLHPEGEHTNPVLGYLLGVKAPGAAAPLPAGLPAGLQLPSAVRWFYQPASTP